MALHIVLFEPEIPTNTGNIGRLSLASGCHLHLVKPYGFEITDSRLKRAGLDYWQHVQLTEHDSIEHFFEAHGEQPMTFFSAKGEKSHWEMPVQDELFLIFGKESVGLPNELVSRELDRTYKIPIYSEHIRSLNLANAVSVVVYEAQRQLSFT